MFCDWLSGAGAVVCLCVSLSGPVSLWIMMSLACNTNGLTAANMGAESRMFRTTLNTADMSQTLAHSRHRPSIIRTFQTLRQTSAEKWAKMSGHGCNDAVYHRGRHYITFLKKI